MGKIKSKGAFLVCVVAVILIVVLLFVGANKNKNNPTGNEGNNPQANNSVTEEFVQKQENGEKVNISEQLKTTKTVAGLELTNIRLVENGGLSQLVADAKNTTSSTIEELDIVITAIDKNGNALAEFEASVYGVAPGKTTRLQAGITSDIANAYDFTVRKK